MACPNLAEFEAWFDQFPGPEATPSLRVTGQVEVNGDAKVSLTPRIPPGFNPTILLLDLMIAETSGSGMKMVPVEFVTREDTHRLEAVHIYSNNEKCAEVTIKVAG